MRRAFYRAIANLLDLGKSGILMTALIEKDGCLETYKALLDDGCLTLEDEVWRPFWEQAAAALPQGALPCMADVDGVRVFFEQVSPHQQLVICGGGLLFDMPFLPQPVNAVGVALCHTVFNVCTTILLLPFTRQLEALAKRVISTEDKPSDFAFLDPRLLRTPGVAVSECASMTNRMGELARENIRLALEQFDRYSEEQEEIIRANEDKLDIYEDRLGSYLVQLSQHGTSADDMNTVSRLLHAIGDFERIGDHALNLLESAKELHDKGLSFSHIAGVEADVLIHLTTDLLDGALDCFENDDVRAARGVEPLEETMDYLTEEIRSRHIRRLQNGQCTIQLGFVLNDLLNNLERVGDHCSNIALSVIEEQTDEADSHAYVHSLKKDQEFNLRFQQDLKRYALPNEE